MRLSNPAAALAVTALLSAAALIGCGSTDDGTATVKTVVERVTVDQQASATATTEDVAVVEQNAAEDAAAEEAAKERRIAKRAAAREKAADERAAERRAEKRAERRAEKRAAAADCETVPNVVGMENLQVSQDALQEAGFYLMKQNDATGAGRSQLWDRNWIVVRQSPAGGTCKPITALIRTWSKKIGE